MKVGHHRHASETPFERADSGPRLKLHVFWYLAHPVLKWMALNCSLSKCIDYTRKNFNKIVSLNDDIGWIFHKWLVQIHVPPIYGFFQMRSLKIILLSVCSLFSDKMFELNYTHVQWKRTTFQMRTVVSKRIPKICFQCLLSLNAGQKYCRMLQGEHSAIISTFLH